MCGLFDVSHISVKLLGHFQTHSTIYKLSLIQCLVSARQPPALWWPISYASMLRTLRTSWAPIFRAPVQDRQVLQCGLWLSPTSGCVRVMDLEGLGCNKPMDGSSDGPQGRGVLSKSRICYPKCADKNSQEDLGFGNWFSGVCLVGLDAVIIGLEGQRMDRIYS